MALARATRAYLSAPSQKPNYTRNADTQREHTQLGIFMRGRRISGDYMGTLSIHRQYTTYILLLYYILCFMHLSSMFPVLSFTCKQNIRSTQNSVSRLNLTGILCDKMAFFESTIFHTTWNQ